MPSSIMCMGGPLDGKMTSNTVDFVHEDGTRYTDTDMWAGGEYRIFYALDMIPSREVMPRLLDAYMRLKNG